MVTRILNVVDAAGRTRIPPQPGPFPVAGFSTEPCVSCPSRCCARQVVLSTAEAIRIGFTLGLRLRAFVEPKAWTRSQGQRFAWPFKLDDGGRTVLRFVQSAHGCTHLARPGSATSRCGIYALRPAVCRLYPFTVDDDGERLAVGSQDICPTQWLQTDATRKAAGEAVAALRVDREHDRQIVLAWNRGHRERTFEGLLDFLEGSAASAVGHDPDRASSFPG